MHLTRILLVEPGPEEAGFLREALLEAEERRLWEPWRSTLVVSVDDLQDAIEVAAQDNFDLVMLDLHLPDSIGFATFLRMQEAVPGIPIVVLVPRYDESGTLRLLRCGAQEVVALQELDCERLARVVAAAIARQQAVEALRAGVFVDDLTGFYTARGFRAMGERYLHLCARVGQQASLLMVEPSSDLRALGPEERELALIEIAERLRSGAGEHCIAGRLSHSSFGLLGSEQWAGEMLFTIGNRTGAGAKIHWSTAPFDPDHPCSLDDLLAAASSRCQSPS